MMNIIFLSGLFGGCLPLNWPHVAWLQETANRTRDIWRNFSYALEKLNFYKGWSFIGNGMEWNSTLPENERMSPEEGPFQKRGDAARSIPGCKDEPKLGALPLPATMVKWGFEHVIVLVVTLTGRATPNLYSVIRTRCLKFNFMIATHSIIEAKASKMILLLSTFFSNFRVSTKKYIQKTKKRKNKSTRINFPRRCGAFDV